MSTTGEPAGLLRQLGAFFYDALLLTPLLMLSTLLFLPLNGGVAITSQSAAGALEYAYRAFLLLVTFLYFGFCWTRSGQTLGLSAWKLRIERADGKLPTWKDALLRFAAAIVAWLPAGAGVFWMLIDKQKLTWQDRWSRTRMVKAKP